MEECAKWCLNLEPHVPTSLIISSFLKNFEIRPFSASSGLMVAIDTAKKLADDTKSQ